MHCESKCMWRATNNCTPGGSLNPTADMWCGNEVCWGKSGYCDCNGNQIWEANETGITCGMNKRPKKIRCNKECMIYNCTYQFFTTGNCTADGAGETMYGKSKYQDLESEDYKSVKINHDGCKVTIFDGQYLTGPHKTYVGTNTSGPECINFGADFVDRAQSAQSTDQCHMPPSPPTPAPTPPTPKPTPKPTPQPAAAETNISTPAAESNMSTMEGTDHASYVGDINEGLDWLVNPQDNVALNQIQKH